MACNGSIFLPVVMLLEIFLQRMSITTRNIILASHTHTSLENLSLKTKRLRISLLTNISEIFELRVLKDKEPFFLTEILLDLKEMSYEFGLDSPPSRLTHTYQLKKTLLSRLGDKINIFRFGHCDVVISKEVEPLFCSYATITGHGLDRKEGLQQRKGTLLITKNRMKM